MAWSAWQPGFEFEAPAVFQDGAGTFSSSSDGFSLGSVFRVFEGPDTVGLYASFADAIAAFTDQLAAVISPTDPVSGGSDGWSEGFEIDLDIDALIPGAWSSDLEIVQWFQTLGDSEPFLPDPPLPSGVSVFEFESDVAERLGWLPWVIDYDTQNFDYTALNITVNQGTDPQDIGFDDFETFVSFRLVDVADLSIAAVVASQIEPDEPLYPASSWPAAGLGTELVRRTLTSLAGADPDLPEAEDRGPFTIPLDEIGNPDVFTILAQPGSMLDGVVPPLHSPVANPDDTLIATAANSSWNQPRGGEVFAPIPPTIRYVTPRWRYQLTDAIYTIGGHWSDPNGVQVMRLKDDGVTWIPIVDGLAPPLR